MDGLRHVVNTILFTVLLLNSISASSAKSATSNLTPSRELKLQHRSSEPEWTSFSTRDMEGPGTYSFGYDTEDIDSGNVQFRQEKRGKNGAVTGSYGHVEPDGNVQVVHYIADENGYRATIENSKRGTYNLPQSSEALVSNPSPQLSAALASLNNLQNSRNKYDEHVRPVSQPGRKFEQENSGNEPVLLNFVPAYDRITHEVQNSQIPHSNNYNKGYLPKFSVTSKYVTVLGDAYDEKPNRKRVDELFHSQMQPYFIGKIAYVLQPNQFVRPAHVPVVDRQSYIPNREFIIKALH